MTHLHSALVADVVIFRGGWKNNRPRLSAWIYSFFFSNWQILLPTHSIHLIPAV